jgi:hypothetical protein
MAPVELPFAMPLHVTEQALLVVNITETGRLNTVIVATALPVHVPI